MPEITIRPYSPQDWNPVVEVWNASVVKDPLTPERFWRLILLDPNFRSGGLLVAESEGEVVGWMQVVSVDEKAWLTAFCVHPSWHRRGIAKRL